MKNSESCCCDDKTQRAHDVFSAYLPIAYSIYRRPGIFRWLKNILLVKLSPSFIFAATTARLNKLTMYSVYLLKKIFHF